MHRLNRTGWLSSSLAVSGICLISALGAFAVAAAPAVPGARLSFPKELSGTLDLETSATGANVGSADYAQATVHWTGTLQLAGVVHGVAEYRLQDGTFTVDGTGTRQTPRGLRRTRAGRAAGAAPGDGIRLYLASTRAGAPARLALAAGVRLAHTFTADDGSESSESEDDVIQLEDGDPAGTGQVETDEDGDPIIAFGTDVDHRGTNGQRTRLTSLLRMAHKQATTQCTNISITPNTVGLPADGGMTRDVTIKATIKGQYDQVYWRGSTGGAPFPQPDEKKTQFKLPYFSPGKKTIEIIPFKSGSRCIGKKVEFYVASVTFSGPTGGGDPFRVGITANGHNRQRTYTAQVNPPEAAKSVTLKVAAGSDKMKIVPQKAGSDGKITFTAEGLGTSGSGSQNDVRVEATVAGDSKPCGKQTFTVIVPKFVASQTKSGPMVTADWVLNASTSPAVPTVPQGRGVPATWRGWLVQVRVQDQFHHDCGDLYGGADVSETFQNDPNPAHPMFYPINRSLGSDSTYPDPVGYVTNDAGTPTQKFTSVDHKPGDSAVTFSIAGGAAASTQTFSAYVDGFKLEPQITRTVTPTPPDKVEVTMSP